MMFVLFRARNHSANKSVSATGISVVKSGPKESMKLSSDVDAAKACTNSTTPNVNMAGAFKTHSFLIQNNGKKKPNDSLSSSSSNQLPESKVFVLEVQSDCSFESQLNSIVRFISAKHNEGNFYPPLGRYHCSGFKIDILPRSAKPVHIPNNPGCEMKVQSLYAIRIRVTQDNCTTPNDAPSQQPPSTAVSSSTVSASRTATSVNSGISAFSHLKVMKTTEHNTSSVSDLQRLPTQWQLGPFSHVPSHQPVTSNSARVRPSILCSSKSVSSVQQGDVRSMSDSQSLPETQQNHPDVFSVIKSAESQMILSRSSSPRVASSLSQCTVPSLSTVTSLSLLASTASAPSNCQSQVDNDISGDEENRLSRVLSMKQTAALCETTESADETSGTSHIEQNNAKGLIKSDVPQPTDTSSSRAGSDLRLISPAGSAIQAFVTGKGIPRFLLPSAVATPLLVPVSGTTPALVTGSCTMPALVTVSSTTPALVTGSSTMPALVTGSSTMPVLIHVGGAKTVLVPGIGATPILVPVSSTTPTSVPVTGATPVLAPGIGMAPTLLSVSCSTPTRSQTSLVSASQFAAGFNKISLKVNNGKLQGISASALNRLLLQKKNVPQGELLISESLSVKDKKLTETETKVGCDSSIHPTQVLSDAIDLTSSSVSVSSGRIASNVLLASNVLRDSSKKSQFTQNTTEVIEIDDSDVVS